MSQLSTFYGFPLTLVVLLFLVGCDGYTSVGGTVQDEGGHPVAGATVTLRIDGEPLGSQHVTEETGDFYVAGTHGVSSQPSVFVESDGFEPLEKTVTPNTKHEGLVLVLEKEKGD